jgi:hypothetical protein
MASATQATKQGCCDIGDVLLWGANSKRFDSHDDAALAKEMNELTVQERGRIFDEMHGVAKEQDETPEFVANSLDLLDEALGRLPYSKRRDWDRALFLKPSIQKDSTFKIMFLRTESFDACRAAERMARFFTLKRFLFGDEKLVKTITLDDLDEPEIELLTSGAPPILVPNKDQTGRPILFNDTAKLFTFESLRSVVREPDRMNHRAIIEHIVKFLVCSIS